MKEIISLEQADRLFLAAAILLLIVGAGIAARRKSVRAGAAVAMAGIANYALWKLYNVITGRFGLDTMINLYLNLALFVGLGLIAGWIIGRSLNRPTE